MQIETALKIIKKQLKNNKFKESRHFKIQCKERNIQLTPQLLKKDIVGIINQGDNKFKIWFEYNENKDLNIILQIINNKLKLITIFPCKLEKRRK
jgi:hypothetical protein